VPVATPAITTCPADVPALQIDDDEGRDRIERRKSHDRFLLDVPAVGAAGPASIVDQPLQQPDRGGKFLLLSRREPRRNGA